MTLSRRKLSEWVTRRALTPPAATAFRLFHEGRYGLAQVASIALAGAADDWPELVSRSAAEEAAEHAEAFPGRQQYVVRAFAEGLTEPVGEFPFGLTAGPSSTEPTAQIAINTPDHQAAMMGQIPLQDFSHPHAMVMAQQMRHNEALIKFVVELSMHSRTADGQIIARQQSHIDNLEGDRLKVAEHLEDMLSRKQERQIIQDKWDTDKKRKDALLGKLMQFVIPELTKKIGLDVGKTGLNNSELDEVKQLFLKLPEETQNAIVKQLPEEDSSRLLEIFEGRATIKDPN